MIDRLFRNWVYGGFLSAFILIGFGFVFLQTSQLLLLLIYLHLPIYQIHQFEEHDRDRFRIYINRELGGGLELLGPGAVFVINIVGVWFLFAVLISLAFLISPGWGLGVIYATLINAVIHIASAIRSRCYNPGLVTSVILFLPLSVITSILSFQSVDINWVDQLAGLAIGVGLHLLIVFYCAVQWKRKRPESQSG